MTFTAFFFLQNFFIFHPVRRDTLIIKILHSLKHNETYWTGKMFENLFETHLHAEDDVFVFTLCRKSLNRVNLCD